MPMIRKIGRLWSRKAVTNGFSVGTSCFLASSKTGDSASRMRMRRPTMTTTPDSRNGTRQPHAAGQQDGPPPAPGVELVLGQRVEEGERAGREQRAGRRADLRPGAVEAAALLGGVLDRQERPAGPLAADGEALDRAEEDEEDRGEDPDVAVGRQHADRDGRGAHHEERDDEHRLAADAVAEVAEEGAAEGAEEESDAERGEGGERADGRVGVGEEEVAEDERGGRAVEEEVVPLDGGSDEGREGHLLDGAHGAGPLAAQSCFEVFDVAHEGLSLPCSRSGTRRARTPARRTLMYEPVR